MPFDKSKLTQDFFDALASEVAEDDDKTREMLRGIADTMATGVELNPAVTVLDNEEKIAQLETRVDDLEKQAAEFQSFLDSLDARLGTVETKVQQVGGAGGAGTA